VIVSGLVDDFAISPRFHEGVHYFNFVFTVVASELDK
jgi:hypothetical protein